MTSNEVKVHTNYDVKEVFKSETDKELSQRYNRLWMDIIRKTEELVYNKNAPVN